MSDDKHTIRNGIIIGVAVTLIASFLFWLIGYVPLFWGWTKCSISSFWGWLVSTPEISVWLLLLLGVATIPTVVLVIQGLLKLRAPSGPAWRDYTEDTFDNMIWCWDYNIKNRICHLLPRCPKDFTQLVPVNADYESAGWYYKCETCESEFGPFSQTQLGLNEAIERQIEKKVTTDQWRHVVEGIQPAVVIAKAKAILEALNGLTEQQRNAFPSEKFVNDYNQVRELAKKVRPDLEQMLPPRAEMNEEGLSMPVPDVSYPEIQAFCQQIVNLLK